MRFQGSFSSMSQYLVPLDFQIILHGSHGDTSLLVILGYTAVYPLGLPLFFSVAINNAAMNSHVQGFVGT